MINIHCLYTGIISWIISIYTFSIKTIDGTSINLNQYKGKKILLVNIATNSPHAAKQLPELEEFYQQHKDSIIVIAFPSNSFNNEPLTNSELSSVLQNTYHISFPVVEKTTVTGNDAHSIYKWLQSAADNGVTNAVLKDDFQKFLINSNGELTGLFVSTTSVLGDKVQRAIKY